MQKIITHSGEQQDEPPDHPFWLQNVELNIKCITLKYDSTVKYVTDVTCFFGGDPLRSHRSGTVQLSTQ